MIVYRLSKRQYAAPLTGKGAEMHGGRWNNRGTALLYTSSSRALCMVEVAVHLPLGRQPKEYVLTTVDIPSKLVCELQLDSLPDDWDRLPPGPKSKTLGDAFVVSGEGLALKVPSAVVPGEWNYLVNPAHKDFSKVQITAQEDFGFDARLFGQSEK